ncbi:DEP domain-containing protein 4 [Clupea harengus]|uniref:DEP domain-containing protein 4 n=1 Tax=Clupea harengus TaxID=7950 RepID=A0A6P3VX22_CLUHA|nr:DEP domain-containing protein 4 [Clupea harengus]
MLQPMGGDMEQSKINPLANPDRGSTSRFRMAVDLTPRFRRLNSQTRSFRLNGRSLGSSGPFRATQLWRNIIQALQTQVEVRRRRQHLRVHNDCFTGADAVDVVLSHLMQNILFCSSEVSRLKAARLCQALMESRVFQPVGTKLFRREKETAFEDSSHSLYRFVDCNALPGSEKRGTDSENWSPGPHQGKKKKGSRLEGLRTISNPLAMGSSDRRVERLLQTINLHPTMPSSHKHAPSTTFLSKKLVEEVWKQQTLLQLLQIVDLPVLESILASPIRTEPPHTATLRNHNDLVISNTCVEREVSQSLNLPDLDCWLAAAADCLELFPDQLIVVVGEQLVQQESRTSDGEERLANQKRLLFDTISKYYNCQEGQPLLCGRYLDIHIGILQLLDSGRMEEALRASQLCMRLLASSRRDELRRLLAFMAAAADPTACRLQKQAENGPLVCKTFLKTVLQSKDMTRAQSEHLQLFLMDNHTQLFKTPMTLVESVRRTLQGLQQGTDPVNVPMFRFCQQVSRQEYESQREQATLEGLKQLIIHISNSSTLSAKDKKRLVKDFQKHHPGAFLQHFSATF